MKRETIINFFTHMVKYGLDASKSFKVAENDVSELGRFGIDAESDVTYYFAHFCGEIGVQGLCLGLSLMTLSDSIQHNNNFKKYYENDGYGVKSYIIDTIKEDYFNPKWVPIAHDGSGNYIGIDCDPGCNGTFGQIINFGRDEEYLYVLSKDIASFFQLLMEESNNNRYLINELDETMKFIKWNLGNHGYESFSLKEQVVSSTCDLDFQFSENWKQTLLKSIENPFTADKISNIKTLNLLKSGINELSPLQYFSGCRKLIGSGIGATDFTPVSQMETLTELHLAKTSLSSLDSILKLGSLKVLSIGNTKVSSISGIQRLKNLTRLSLDNLRLVTIEPLWELKKLKELSLSGTSGYDITEVSNLIALER